MTDDLSPSQRRGVLWIVQAVAFRIRDGLEFDDLRERLKREYPHLLQTDLWLVSYAEYYLAGYTAAKEENNEPC